MLPFIHQTLPARVIFGDGAVSTVSEEVDALGVHSVLVVSTPELAGTADQVAKLLGVRAAGVFSRAVMHVPTSTVRAACTVAKAVGADATIALGGGSAIGLAKAVALELGLPIVAIPTTYAGSEATPIYGLTDGGVKTTGRDARVLPRAVIYDPELTLSLPLALSMASGLNAIAHAAEGLYAHDASPIIALVAEEGIRALACALPAIQQGRNMPRARGSALYGSWLCGTVLGSVSMGLHHKLCHTLGGTFNLPHAQTHAVVLPHALAYNALAAPHAMSRVARALGAQGAARGAFDLAVRLGVPTSLKQIGMPPDGLDRAAEIAVSMPYPNPQSLDRESIRQLLQRAFDGEAPPQHGERA